MKTEQIAELPTEDGCVRFRVLADGGVLFALPDGRTHGSIPPAETMPRHPAALLAHVAVSIAMQNYVSNDASTQFSFHARAKR